MAYVMYRRLYFVKDRIPDLKRYPLSLCHSTVTTGNVRITAKEKDRIEIKQKNTVYLSIEKMQNQPLFIRFRKEGDYFYPAGFGHKKKLQDYFVDEKIPSFKRDFIPLLLVGDEIAWVCGYRADSRFVPEKKESKLMEITYTEDKGYAPRR